MFKSSGTSFSFDRRVWLLLLAMLAFRFGQGMYFPFSTIHFHNVVGIPLSLVGVGLAALAAASVASGLVSGPLSDRYGRKPVMLAALAGSAAAFCAFSLVEGFAGYLLVSVAAGLAGNTTFDAARNAMVADVTEPGRRSRAYGLVRVGGNVGWALGPMVAGLAAATVASGGSTGRSFSAPQPLWRWWRSCWRSRSRSRSLLFRSVRPGWARWGCGRRSGTARS